MSKNLPPDAAADARLRVYHALLLKWQKAVNLIAPSTVDDAWARHFEDSLQILPILPESAAVLADIGCGAGFPGLVIALARPDLKVNLIESDSRKGAFLLAVSRETGAKNVNHFNERAESALKNIRADVVTARALAALPQLLAWTESQWGRADDPATLVFPKGEGWQDEVDDARAAGYDFDVEATPSRTQAGAAILCITHVRRKTQA